MQGKSQSVYKLILMSYPESTIMKSITFHGSLRYECGLRQNPCAMILMKHSKKKTKVKHYPMISRTLFLIVRLSLSE